MAFDPKNYQFSTGEHENRKMIFVHFEYTQLLHKELKKSSQSQDGTHRKSTGICRISHLRPFDDRWQPVRRIETVRNRNCR